MYKKICLFLSASSLLLLPGCLDKRNKTEPAIQAPSDANIEAEAPAPSETVAEIMPQQEQAPQLAKQATVIHLSSSGQLQELINKGNAVVDFYATWCGPCKSVSPVIDRLAQQYAGKIQFIKVNVDTFKDLANKFNIKGMPTFLLFKDGQKVDSFSGARNKEFFEQKIKSLFNV